MEEPSDDVLTRAALTFFANNIETGKGVVSYEEQKALAPRDEPPVKKKLTAKEERTVERLRKIAAKIE